MAKRGTFIRKPVKMCRSHVGSAGPKGLFYLPGGFPMVIYYIRIFQGVQPHPLYIFYEKMRWGKLLYIYLSSNFVVVKIHSVPDVFGFFRSSRLRCVHELSTEFNSVFDIVTTPTPLPAFYRMFTFTRTDVTRARG